MKTRPLGESAAVILSLSRHLLGPPRPHFVTREGGQALGPLPGLAAVTRAHHASLGPPTQPGWQGRRPAKPQAAGAPPRRLWALSAGTEACVSTGLRSAAGDVVATCPGHVARGPAHNRPGFLRPGTLGQDALPSAPGGPPRRRPRPAHQGHPPGQQQLRLTAQSPEVVDHVQDTAAGQPLREPEQTPCSRPVGSRAGGRAGRAQAPRRSWACCTRGPWPWSWR